MQRGVFPLIVLASITAWSQALITTVAGTSFLFDGNNKPALSATLGSLRGLALAPSGDVYFSDHENHIVGKIAPNGILTVVAGNGVPAFSGDGGPAVNAALLFPEAIALDPSGNLYIADSGNARIRKVTPDGVIRTLATLVAFGGPCPPASGGFASNTWITSMVADASGALFFGTTSEDTTFRLASVCKVAVDGTLTRIAGIPSNRTDIVGTDLNGAMATESTLRHAGLAMDPAGALYIADVSQIYKLGSDGRLQRVAGCFPRDCPASSNKSPLATTLNEVFNIGFDPQADLLIIDLGRDSLSPLVYKVTPAGVTSLIASNGVQGFSGDGGPAVKAQLSAPFEIAGDASGNVYIGQAGTVISDVIIQGAGRIREITPDGIIHTVAGNGLFHASGDGGLAVNATLDNTWGGVAVDRLNNVYFADAGNNKIRKIASNGIITTVAGDGTAGFSGDGGSALAAQLNFPSGIALDTAGNVFFADTLNNRLRKISPNGIISTVIQGNVKFVAADAAGNIYFNGGGLDQTMKVSPDGTSQTVTGSPAAPAAIAVDSGGNLYFGTVPLATFTRVGTDGSTRTVATKVSFNNLCGLTVDAGGNIIAGFGGQVLRIAPNGAISPVAGTGKDGYSGDGGPPTSAAISEGGAVVCGLTFDAAGNLYLSDNGNFRIRKVLVTPPQVQTAPAQLQFNASSGGAIPATQGVSLVGAIPGLGFSAQADAAWLSVSPSDGSTPRLLEVIADPTGIDPGSYSANLRIMVANATPAILIVPVTFNVMAPLAPKLSTDKQSLSFPFSQNGAARSQSVTVSNSGGGTLTYVAEAQTRTGGDWLSVTPSAGNVEASSPIILTVTADPTGIAPGTYSGAVIVTAGGDQQRIPVTMTISTTGPGLLLSQSGLSFLGVSRGGIVAPQAFGVINIGTGVVHWTVSTSTLSGDAQWLQVGTTNGSTDAAAAIVPSVMVNVNPAILPAGNYYGQVRVDSPDAANAPQVITIFLQVLPAGSDIGASAQPSELVFSAQAGSESPGSQDLLLYNVTADAKSFRSSVTSDAGLQILILPTDGLLDPQRPNRVVVQPLTASLAPGVYHGALTLQFSDGRVRALRLSVIVAAGPAQDSTTVRRAGAVCTPSVLVEALTTLGQSFNVVAGYPIGLGVQVTDDCGTPLEAGSVSVSFSNGDPAVPLQSTKGGRWEGTWNSQSKNAAQVILKLQASDATGALHGERQIQGSAEAQADPPTFDRSGIFSAASAEKFVPVAPGSIISIYGNGLATDTKSYSTTPLPQTLLTTNAFMAGRLLPLYYVSPGQINAQVPFDINVNTSMQIYIQKGTTASQPISVDVAPAQPAIFAIQGSPATAGNVIQIYASGLGVVNPPIAAGAVPGSTLSTTVNQVQVTIANTDAPVLFAGLAPGFVGLYQVNVMVPSGVTPGNSIPLTLSVGGQTGPSANIAVQ